MATVNNSELLVILATWQGKKAELEKKLLLYQEQVNKGNVGFWDLVFDTKQAIKETNAVLELLEHPERNP